MKLMSNGKDGGFKLVLILAVAAGVAAGCQKNDPAGSYGAISPVAPQEPELNLSANAGVPKQPGAPVSPQLIAESRTFSSRPDPFALMPSERQFDLDQRTEGYLQANGSYAIYVEPELEDPGTAQPPVVEPLPAWRLSGVIIGNGVMALLDTGNRVYEIRPGMMVPGTQWRVVSIDAERALMRREGSNRLPSEFYVTLQGPIGGGLNGGGGGGTGGGGGAPANNPGRGGGGGGAAGLSGGG